MRSKLGQMARRLAEIDLSLQSPEVTDDLDNYRRLTREHAELAPVAEQFLARWRT